ncbi:MAG: hypothetical protein DRP16_02290 [Candidatus Aenigmatarchaeota archaeon]|nr:MAG: hypothetical protein DRP16_02290 [Candidatus Aenigmarchaeota archaeon]
MFHPLQPVIQKFERVFVWLSSFEQRCWHSLKKLLYCCGERHFQSKIFFILGPCLYKLPSLCTEAVGCCSEGFATDFYSRNAKYFMAALPFRKNP